MARKSKSADDENLTDTAFERVISLLAAEKPITKKVACEMLRISYNTARLDKLLQTYKDKKDIDAKRRAEKRGTPATKQEITYIIGEYLEGTTIDSICKSLYRGPTFVKNVVEELGLPERSPGHSYFRPELIPDKSVKDRFGLGEKVYSARYASLARIDSESINKEGIPVYRIYLLHDNQKQYAYQPVYELASLEHLKEYYV